MENRSTSNEQTIPLAGSLCWDCQSEIGGAYYCTRCVKVQPLSQEGDYFEYFGFPRILNLDPAILETRYYELSRAFHPDFFETKSQIEKSISLGNSAILNTAYRTLKDPIQRVQYLLELEAGTRKTGPAIPPADLFEELLEIQEDVTAFKQAADDSFGKNAADVRNRLTASKTLLEGKLEQLRMRLQELSNEWDQFVGDRSGPAPSTSDKARLLNQLREVISNQNYIARVLNDINAGGVENDREHQT